MDVIKKPYHSLRMSNEQNGAVNVHDNEIMNMSILVFHI